MADVKVVLNSEGVRSLLRSREMMDYCTDLAQGIQQRAGEGYEISRHTGANRVNVSVGTGTVTAASENRGGMNTLLRAVRG